MDTSTKLRAVLALNVKRLMGDQPQEWLEARSGLGQTTISRVLNMGGAATLDTVEALAKGLGVLPWELLIEDGETRQAIVQRFLNPAAPKSPDQ